MSADELERKLKIIQSLNLEITKTEILIDVACRGLEEARAQRTSIQEEIEIAILEDSVNFPSILMDEICYVKN